MFTKNGEKIFEDSQVSVIVNVNPQQDGIAIKYHRALDCIKISAHSKNAHFIQFVTRQCPDLYAFNKSRGTEQVWESVTPFYMTDLINPKWKLDVVKESQTCFYEERGLHKKDENSVSMYDDPSGIALPDEDRATFCTFVMVNDKITHLVKWSKQTVKAEQSNSLSTCYWVWAQAWENKPLPLWAVDILLSHYKSLSKNPPPELISTEILDKLEKTSKEQIEIESRSFFLQPPKEWVTISKFPVLFKDFENLTEKKIEIEKSTINTDVQSSVQSSTQKSATSIEPMLNLFSLERQSAKDLNVSESITDFSVGTAPLSKLSLGDKEKNIPKQ